MSVFPWFPVTREGLADLEALHRWYRAHLSCVTAAHAAIQADGNVPPHLAAYADGQITAREALEVDDLRRVAA